MLEGVVELLSGLVMGALSLLITVSIAGSIIAALRAVSRGGQTEEYKAANKVRLASAVRSDNRSVEHLLQTH